MNTQPYLRISLNLERSGSGTTHSRIVEAIREQINGHGQVDGYRLPPVRVLAHQLSVSKNTVQAAYDELVAQGLIESKERVGLFVAARENARTAPSDAKQKVAAPVMQEWKIPSKVASEVVDLGNVFIDSALLPLERLSAAFRSVAQSGRLPVQYDLAGYRPLREIIAQRLNQRGIEAKAEHIIITIGSQMALDLAFRSLARKVVAVESPSYYAQKLKLVDKDFQVVELPVDPFNGLDLELWEKRIKAQRPALVSLVPNFQNPTGYTYSTAERNEILKWAGEYGFGLLEDDWGSDMMSYSEFSPCFRSRGGDGVLYVNSFTKKLLPSLRLGYILGNEETVHSLARIKSYSTLGNPMLMEMGLFEFLDKGYYDSHLRSLQSAVDDRYQNCLSLLDEYMPEGVRWTRPGGGPSLWLEIPSDVNRQLLVERMKAKGVVIIVGMDVCGNGKHGLRIGYAAHAPETIDRALKLLAGELKKLMEVQPV